jgi:hypothetical protein
MRRQFIDTIRALTSVLLPRAVNAGHRVEII